jgi:hypothetical protein
LLFDDVNLGTFARLLQFAYALHLQPKSSRAPLLVKNLHLPWNYRGPLENPESQISNNRLIRMVLAFCPSVTALELSWRDEEMLQSDVDALDDFLRLTTQLDSLDVFYNGERPPEFGAEDSAINQVPDPKITFRRGTTDRLRQPQSTVFHPG